MGLFGFGSIGSGDVVARGRCDSAQVTGIVVGGVSGRRKAIDYALRVGAPQPFTAGVRLGAEPPVVVRLGTTLQVLHLETQVVIDWLGSGADEIADSQPLKVAPAPGIEDRSVGLGPMQLCGVPARATITEAAVGAPTRDGGPLLHLTLWVERQGLGGYEDELTVATVPHYADHLCTVGRSLPVWLVPERPHEVVVDWPAAAVADPGIDSPPAPLLGELADMAGTRPRQVTSGWNRVDRGQVATSSDGEAVIDLTGDDPG